ncbi:hypothetical protein TNCV_1213871 [Trichonephila clavipes]|nr:hypothetical protein TNCV_1213871 [Trichonephila clavipes]
MEVTRVEQRSYIKIAVLRGKNVMEYYSELVEALGSNALPYRTVARIEELMRVKSPGDQALTLALSGNLKNGVSGQVSWYNLPVV